MFKTALPDEVLLSVEKPARYIGNEVNMVIKDPKDVDVRFCMCFPDVYEVGMSHLGIQILYGMMNSWSDVYCERVYSPWLDLDRIMREKKIPLFALESGDRVKDFDFLGITLQYEMCYTNVLQILDLSNIPLLARDRTDDDPIVIGGGPCTYNPEPMADFFDIFYIGEGETVLRDLLDTYKECRKGRIKCKEYEEYNVKYEEYEENDAKYKKYGVNGTEYEEYECSRMEFLERATHVEGIYVPMFYSVRYHDDGTIESFTPNNKNAKSKIRKQVVSDLSDAYYPERPLVPYIQAVQDRVVLEIQRGCIRGCRFCQAGMLYRPIRERSVSCLKALARKMIDSTGYDEITLSSLSSSDYKGLGELIYHLVDEYKAKGINISLPSLRIDAFALDVMSKVQDVRKSSLTFAPEAGSQRLRNVINKGLSEESILNGASSAFLSGWSKVKLYFMLGLPTENFEDVGEIAVLSDKIARAFYSVPRQERNGNVSIMASTSYFVPKPFTPFQWAGMDTKEEYVGKQRFLKDKFHEQANRRSIKYNWHDANTSTIEGVFARGDRRLSNVVMEAYKNGCIFDAWTEHFKYEKWVDAFARHSLDMSFYNERERPKDEILPWDFIDVGVTKEFLWREYENGMNEVVTPNCRKRCSGCGASEFNKRKCDAGGEGNELIKRAGETGSEIREWNVGHGGVE